MNLTRNQPASKSSDPPNRFLLTRMSAARGTITCNYLEASMPPLLVAFSYVHCGSVRMQSFPAIDFGSPNDVKNDITREFLCWTKTS
jgi:hypothetical protein